MKFFTQNQHLSQSEPGKIDPHVHPRPVRGSHSESKEPTQTLYPQAASPSQCLIYEPGR